MNDEQLSTDIERAFGRYRSRRLSTDSLGSATGKLQAAQPSVVARHRLVGGLSIGGVAVALVAASLLALGLGPWGGAPATAWAAWQPTPTKADPAAALKARDLCPTSMSMGGDKPIPGWSTPIDNLPLLAQDQRGPVALLLFGSTSQGSELVDCLVWHDGESWTVFGSGGQLVLDQIPDMPLWIMGGGQEADAAGGRYVTIFGHTDASRVVIALAGRPQMEATVQNGMFLAWWPGDTQADSVTAYAQDGAVIATETLGMPGHGGGAPSAQASPAS